MIQQIANNYYERLMHHICVLYNPFCEEKDLLKMDARNRKARAVETISEVGRGNEVFQVKYKVARCGEQKFWQFVQAD